MQIIPYLKLATNVYIDNYKVHDKMSSVSYRSLRKNEEKAMGAPWDDLTLAKPRVPHGTI